MDVVFVIPVFIRVFPFLKTVAAHGPREWEGPAPKEWEGFSFQKREYPYIPKLEAYCDCLEAVSLESCTADKTSVDVRASEEFLSVCRVA